MILINSLYKERDPRRQNELLECLRRNIELVRIEEVHLMVEDSMARAEMESHPLFSSEKIRLVEHGRRVTFRDLFAYANRELLGRRVIIANADIYFDRTLARLDDYDLTGKLLCLSRWDVRSDGSAEFFEQPSSQDAWIFQTPIREFPCDFHMGVLGCDNRLAWEAYNAGVKVSNPSRSLRAYHLHLSQIRHWEWKWLNGPTRALPAIFLETPYPSPKGEAPAAPSAQIFFRETMGYNIARLKLGASSHRNDRRRFTAIPDALNGLQFTQVVAWVVSPVEIEFITQGKLYVLVGNDWHGYERATQWLWEMGFKERLPLVETERGTGFEVWSLVAEAGERFTIPTQVMLVADKLVRR